MGEELNPTATRTSLVVPTRVAELGMSIGFAGFLSLMGILSFPLPWTPVPFSLMPFGLLVTGAAQRPGYAAISAAIYLAAGGLGAPVFAGGASGWNHFGEHTAGYLFGFLLVPPIVAAYARNARRLPTRAMVPVIGMVAASMLTGIIAILWIQGQGGLAGLDGELGGWGVTRSVMWFLLFIIAGLTALTVWTLQRRRAQVHATLSLFLAMLGATITLHAVGVTVLWLMTELSLMAAIVLGSVVFLPFDVIKAGAAATLATPFLRESHA